MNLNQQSRTNKIGIVWGRLGVDRVLLLPNTFENGIDDIFPVNLGEKARAKYESFEDDKKENYYAFEVTPCYSTKFPYLYFNILDINESVKTPCPDIFNLRGKVIYKSKEKNIIGFEDLQLFYHEDEDISPIFVGTYYQVLAERINRSLMAISFLEL